MPSFWGLRAAVSLVRRAGGNSQWKWNLQPSLTRSYLRLASPPWPESPSYRSLQEPTALGTPYSTEGRALQVSSQRCMAPQIPPFRACRAYLCAVPPPLNPILPSSTINSTEDEYTHLYKLQYASSTHEGKSQEEAFWSTCGTVDAALLHLTHQVLSPRDYSQLLTAKSQA